MKQTLLILGLAWLLPSQVSGQTLIERVLFQGWRLSQPMATLPCEGIAVEARRIEDPAEPMLVAWVYEGPKSAQPTLIFWHGNAGHLVHRHPWSCALSQQLGLRVVIADYRGYGESQGVATIAGVKTDARRVLSWVVAHWPTQPMFLYGNSLGGAVAANLAAEFPHLFDAVILQSTFTDIQSMAKHLVDWLPIWRLIKRDFASVDVVNDWPAPTLIVHGKNDQIVPAHMGIELFHQRRQNRHLLLLDDVGHNDLVAVYRETLLKRFRGFLNHYVQ